MKEQTKYQFPEYFKWGTSTAAAQIETASDHNWKGIVAKDGAVFEETCAHEKHRQKDLQYIIRFGSIYRCGVDWARLQPKPLEPFDPGVVEEYTAFFSQLNQAGVRLMFVLHHFTHPGWFEKVGGWTKDYNLRYFADYAKRCIQHFGPYTENWNTFNEPNVFAMNAYLLGNFPPFRKNYFLANRVLRLMGKGHLIALQLIKEKYPEAQVGISLNTATFKAQNILGWIPAKFTSWWFHKRAAYPFRKADFWGLSYYAYIPFAPFPITEIDNPGKLEKRGIPHDKMWGYYPKGLGRILKRFHKKYKKPIWITENGICTDDPQQRIDSIRDYLVICHQAIESGIDLRGYIHWSTLDNFEWHLGPSYRFGLVAVNRENMARSMTEAGAYYSLICQENGFD